LVELMFADSGATMVPAPVEGSEVRGHRQRSPNSAAPTVGRSPALAERCGSERSAEFGGVDHTLCLHAHAHNRETRRL
jgi:hypothetical protein